MRSGLPGPLQPPYPALTDVHDAVLRLDVRGDDGRVAVDQHLAARDDEDDGLVVERALLLEVEDLRRVQAVVEQVVLEDLGELRRVREEVAEERLVEVGEGLVVGREDCEGVALLRRALRGYRRESRVKEGSARGLLVGGGWLLRRVAGVHIVASPHNILTCLERRHEAGRRDGRDERRQAGRGLRESDDVLLGEGEVGRDHCSGDAAAGGTEAGVRGGQPRGSHAGPLRTDTVDDVEDAVGRVEVRADDVSVVDGDLAARDADAQRVGRVERRDLLAVRELVGECASRGDVVGQDVAVDDGVEAVRDDCGCGTRRGMQESCQGLNLSLPHTPLTVKDVLAERLEGLVRGAKHGEGAVAAERGKRRTRGSGSSPRRTCGAETVLRSHVTRAKASHACTAQPTEAPPRRYQTRAHPESVGMSPFAKSTRPRMLRLLAWMSSGRLGC